MVFISLISGIITFMMKKTAQLFTYTLCTALLCSCLDNEPEKDSMLMNIDEFSRYFDKVTSDYRDILFSEVDTMLIGYQNTQYINNLAGSMIVDRDSFPLYNSNIMDYISALLSGNYSFFATAFSSIPHGRIDVDVRTGKSHFEPFEPDPDAIKLILNAIIGEDSTYTAVFEANHIFSVQFDSLTIPLANNIKVSLMNRKGSSCPQKTYLEIDYHMELDSIAHRIVANADVDMIGNRYFSLNVQVDDTQFIFNISNTVSETELFNAKFVMVGRNLYSSLLSQNIEAKILVHHLQANCFDNQLTMDADIDNFFSKLSPNKDKLVSIILQFFIQGAETWRGTTSSVLNSSMGVDNFVDMFNNMNIMISTPYNLGYTNPIARIKLSTEYSEEDYVITYVICNDYSTRPLSEIPMFGYKDIYEFSAAILSRVISLILNQ